MADYAKITAVRIQARIIDRLRNRATGCCRCRHVHQRSVSFITQYEIDERQIVDIGARCRCIVVNNKRIATCRSIRNINYFCRSCTAATSYLTKDIKVRAIVDSKETQVDIICTKRSSVLIEGREPTDITVRNTCIKANHALVADGVERLLRHLNLWGPCPCPKARPCR